MTYNSDSNLDGLSSQLGLVSDTNSSKPTIMTAQAWKAGNISASTN